MKKILLTLWLLALVGGIRAQTTYYWVGKTNATTLTTGSSWNTALDGTGSARPTVATGNTDILVFDGSNIGGTVPTTGLVTVNVTATNCGQVRLQNGAQVLFRRAPTGAGGTGTLTINGGAGDDLVIEAGSTLTISSPSVDGNVVVLLPAAATGLISGSVTVTNTGSNRIQSSAAGALVFASGSSFTSSLTPAASAYPFSSASQGAEKGVVFAAGANLYYEGGFSFMGNASTFSAVDFRPGSNLYLRASNPVGTGGSFFNRKSFGNIILENNATLTADGSIYRIGNLTINSGSTVITHTSGQTVLLGDLTAAGSLQAPTGASNELVFAGTTPQTISGTGTIQVPGIVISAPAQVTLARSLTVSGTAVVYGKLDLATHQLTGAGTFQAKGPTAPTTLTGTTVAGSYAVAIPTGLNPSLRGFTVSGTGIPANTSFVSYSPNQDTIYLSQPATAGGSGIALSLATTGATLATANTNGFDPASGSVVLSGVQDYGDGISYIINAATVTPFGLISNLPPTRVQLTNLTLNAPITSNVTAWIGGNLQLQTGKLSLRAGDTLRLLNGATISGNPGPANYIVTGANTGTGAQGVLRIDNLNAAPRVLPIGTADHYLPATLTAPGIDIQASVFEGITQNGLPNGSLLTGAPKNTKVNAVWNLVPVSGAANGTVTLQWTPALEGTTFSTLPDAEIGVIRNNQPGWSLPTTAGNNTSNTATLAGTPLGAFSVGALPPAQPFLFNPLPAKTYGNADFDPGVVSANTTEPVVYTSSNPAVATIVNGQIHIVGAGTSTITATQATDGFFPAASGTQTLTVNKAPLTIRADDKSKPQGDPNPVLTATYTGFVLGETPAVLTAPVVLSTTATTTSPAGSYPITPSGGAAQNYAISFVNGSLTVTPRQPQTITFAALPAKTYGNADFQAGATSTNPTIPITYTSSDPAVATVTGSTIHIVGAGTTTITASQAGSALYFAATPVARTLTVGKAPLTVRVLDTVRTYGQPNPAFTVTYSGFVLGENSSVLSTQPAATTIATANSTPGYYAIDLAGGAASNYSFNYVPGRLTVLPATGTSANYLQVFQSGPGQLTVRVYSPVPDLGDVYIYDGSGRLIQRRNVFIATGFLSYTFPMEIPASGVYVVQVAGKQFHLKTLVPLLK